MVLLLDFDLDAQRLVSLPLLAANTEDLDGSMLDDDDGSSKPLTVQNATVCLQTLVFEVDIVISL